MRFLTVTDVPPEEVLARAKEFFARHSRLRVERETDSMLIFRGELGTAELRVDRAGGHTNVHAETDRVVGLDVTDLTQRFLYTLGHV